MTALALAALSLSLPLPTLSTRAPADAFDRSIVPAGTPFVVHIDVTGFFESSLAEAALSSATIRDEIDIDRVQEEFGIDPLHDIQSITVFSSKPGFSESGAAVVRTTAVVDRLIGKLKEAGELREGRLHGLTVYGVDDALAYVHQGRRDGERLVAFAQDEEELWGAIQVLSGDAPSLGAGTGPLVGAKPRDGAFLFVGVGGSLDDITGDMDGPASKLAKLVRGFSLQVGEQKEKFFVDAAVETSSDEDAQDVANILNGLKSLASLAAGEDMPDFAADLISSIKVESGGTRVRLSFELDSETIAELIREHGDD